jgi:hypothetical protein
VSVRQLISQYTISATPAGRDQYNHLWDLHVDRSVQMDGTEKWAVRWMGRCLGRDGEWDYEPIPSSRSDRWLAQYRHDLETALRLAVAAAPDVEVNGRKASAT